MNKKMKAFLSMGIGVLLISGLLFAINANKGSTNKPVSSSDKTYHYVRSNVLEVTKDERIFETMNILNDSSLVYMVESEDGCYVYKGFGKDRKILSPDVRPTREDLSVKGFTMDDKENLYVVYGVFRGKETMNIYNKNKQLIKADIDMEGDLSEIKRMYYFNEKLYILDYDRNLQIHNTDGKIIEKNNYTGYVLDIDMDDKGNIYMLNESSNKVTLQEIVKLDCLSNQVIFNAKMEIPHQNAIKYGPENENIYTTDGKVIYKFDSSGNLIEEEINFISDVDLVFTETNINKSPDLNTLVQDYKENFYIFSKGHGNSPSNIYMLSKTEGTKPPDNRQEIILTAAYEQDFIIDAIALYNLQSEKYKIVLDAEYKTYEEFMDNVIEAGEKLALRIMTNDVGDVVATGGNGLVYYDVLKTDAFMDLDELIKKDKSYAELSKQALDGMKINEKLRGLPLGITYYRMIYNEELGDALGLNFDLNNIKWSDIFELAIELNNTDSNISVFNTQEENADTYFELLLQANMPDLIDIENKKVNLKQEWFLELMTDFKNASKLNSFMHYRPYNSNNITGDNSIFYFNNLRGQHYDDSLSISNNAHKILQIPVFAGEENRNTIAFPTIMYSISNNSKHKDAAWDFFSYLLEMETQSLLSLNAHPINLRTQKEIQKYYNIDDGLIKQVDEIMNRVDYLYDMSYYKQDILLPMNKYFNDEITLDEAIEEAEYNIWIRLNE